MLFSSFVNFLGTIILISPISIPLCPFPFIYPFPGIDTVSPLSAPCGMYILLSSLSIDFMDILLPNAASHGVISIVVYKFSPFNLNFLSFFMFIFMNKSPGLPPFFPSFPFLLNVFFHLALYL